MKRIIFLTAMLAVGLPLAVAQQQTELDTGPGMVSPDSAFYGLEIAMDNAAMAVGLARPGGVAQERAAEAQAMARKNNSKAVQKAADQLSKVAQKAQERDTQGIEKAAAVLQAVMEQAPEAAQQGLQTAIDNVQLSGDRIGADIASGPRAGGAEGATARIQEARALREQGRQALTRGNDEMDDGNYVAAEDAFSTAADRFTSALNRLQDVDTQAAADLRTALRNAQSGANNLERAVQAYQNDNPQEAEQFADRAQQDFNNTEGGQ